MLRPGVAAAVLLVSAAAGAEERYFPVAHLGGLESEWYATREFGRTIPIFRALSARESQRLERTTQEICDVLHPGSTAAFRYPNDWSRDVGRMGVDWFSGRMDDERPWRCERPRPHDHPRVRELYLHDADRVQEQAWERDGRWHPPPHAVPGDRDTSFAIARPVAEYFVPTSTVRPVAGVSFFTANLFELEGLSPDAFARLGSALDRARFPPVPLYIDACRPVRPERREAAEAAVYRAVLAMVERVRQGRPFPWPNHRYAITSALRPPRLLTSAEDAPPRVPPAFSAEAFHDYAVQNAAFAPFPVSLARELPATVLEFPPPALESRRFPGPEARLQDMAAFLRMEYVRDGAREVIDRTPPGPPEPRSTTVQVSRIGFSSDLTQAVVYVGADGDVPLCGSAVVFRRSGGSYELWGGWTAGTCLVH